MNSQFFYTILGRCSSDKTKGNFTDYLLCIKCFIDHFPV